MLYMISYDLHNSEDNQENVIKLIQSLGAYNLLFATTYLVKSRLNGTQISDKISTALSSNDRLLVFSVTTPISGFLAQDQWNWINRHS